MLAEAEDTAECMSVCKRADCLPVLVLEAAASVIKQSGQSPPSSSRSLTDRWLKPARLPASEVFVDIPQQIRTKVCISQSP